MVPLIDLGALHASVQASDEDSPLGFGLAGGEVLDQEADVSMHEDYASAFRRWREAMAK